MDFRPSLRPIGRYNAKGEKTRSICATFDEIALTRPMYTAAERCPGWQYISRMDTLRIALKIIVHAPVTRKDAFKLEPSHQADC